MLIANECLDSRLRSDILGVLCKLDLEKADDNVHWNFYIYICFGSVVLVLDGGWFLSQLKRVETERPFVPSFVHHHYGGTCPDARESWKRQFTFQDFQLVATSQLVISHLLFADDTLSFCGVDPKQIWHLKAIFIHIIFGLKINLGKYELVPIGDVLNAESL